MADSGYYVASWDPAVVLVLMKILHVETGRHLYGGPQQVIYLLKALRDRGHECTLVCPPDSGIDSAARQAAIPVRNLFCAGDLDLPFAYRLSQYLRVLTINLKNQLLLCVRHVTWVLLSRSMNQWLCNHVLNITTAKKKKSVSFIA